MNKKLNPKEINTTALAFLGDAVYEVFIRKYVMETGQQNADVLHKMAIKYVCAAGQAKAVKSLMGDFLTEEEIGVVKRARNRKSISRTRSADAVTYKLATAFEALLGYLSLGDEQERMQAIMEEAVKRIEER